MDEFWISPLQIEDGIAVIRGCFNDFTVTIKVESKRNTPVTKEIAEDVYRAVVAQLPDKDARGP